MAHTGNRGKYGNRFTEYNGHMYQSMREANHAKNLDTMRRAVNPKDRVVSIECQVKYPLIIQTSYIADFVVKFADGHEEVQDAKGFRTREYKMKKRAMKNQHKIDIVEI